MISGPFIDIQALNPDPRLRNAPAASTERLTQATGLSIGALRLDQDDRFKDIKVLVGRAQGPARLAFGESNVVVTARSDGSFIALLPNATIRGDANGQQTLIPAETRHSHEPGNIDYVQSEQAQEPNLLQTRNGQRSFQVDRNAQGETVIDLLAGFSQAAADYIGDHEAYALAQVASVNHALRQSQIEGVRLRLVGTQVIAEDHPITSGPDGTMRKVSTLFAEGMRQYSPDLVTGFFVGTPGVDTMLGWGNIMAVTRSTTSSRPPPFATRWGTTSVAIIARTAAATVSATTTAGWARSCVATTWATTPTLMSGTTWACPWANWAPPTWLACGVKAPSACPPTARR